VGISQRYPSTTLDIGSMDSWGTSLQLDASIQTGGKKWKLESSAGDHSQGRGKLVIRNENAGTYPFAILDNGNVGIGITSPIKKLDILTGTSSQGMVVRSSTTASNVAGHLWPGTGGFVIDSRLGNLTGAANLHLRTGGKDRLYIRGSNGNVGIGTTSPSARLQVADTNLPAGTKFILVGDDTFLTDLDIANTMGIYGNQDSRQARIQLGSGGAKIRGLSNGDMCIGSGC